MSSPSKVLTAVSAALVACATLTSPATASTAMEFTVEPGSKGSLSPGGDYFVVEAALGAVVTETLRLANPGSKPVEVRLAPVDATTAQFGGVDYSPSDREPKAVGAWIELGKKTLELAPGAVATVPFTVSVPRDAAPGVNLGGIAAWTPPRAGKSSDREGLGATAEVQTRRVVAVQVDLPGPAGPVLEIEGVRAAARPDGVYLQIDLRNTGTGFAEGGGTVELSGEDFSVAFALDKVVPGTDVAYPVRWREKAPPEGRYPVVVEIDYGTGVVEHRGEVVIGGGLRSDLADRGIGRPGTRRFPATPAVAAAAAVLSCATVFVWRRRRSRRTPATASAASARPAGSSSPPPPPPGPRPGGPPPPPSGAPRRHPA